MTREDIIRMAREASNTPIDHHATPDLFGVSQIERFAALVIANNPPQSFMAWQEGFEAGSTKQNIELAALREFAGGRCAIQSVIDAVGPMSLWSKDAFERELEKARAEEREACAKVCDERADEDKWEGCYANACAEAIRARGNT